MSKQSNLNIIMSTFKKGETVTWTTPRGNQRTGEIVAIVPKGEDCVNAFSRLNGKKFKFNGDINASGYGRDHKSYLVAVTVRENGQRIVFWPKVSSLELVG